MNKDPLSQLDEGQQKAVTSQAKNILCLAGAGSGKTRVLTTRVFYLVKKLNIPEENILSITFTKNAAAEMLERLAKLGIDTEKLWCRTFHSACYKILRELNPKLNMEIIDETRQGDILTDIIKKLSRHQEFGYRLSRFMDDNNWPLYLLQEEIFKIIKECRNRSVGFEKIIRRCQKEKNVDIVEFYRLLYVIKSQYEKYLKMNNIYDFSDLINEVNLELENGGQALKYYRGKFKHILVDEFQDVDFTQMKFLKILNGTKNNMFVVGDDWQSIYGFRGGNVSYILNFQKYFLEDNETIILPYNYRSDGHVVYSASKFIKKNKRQHKKKIKSFSKSKLKIKIFRGRDEAENVKFVLKAIRTLLKHNISKSDIMVIGRNWKNLHPYIKIFNKNKLNNIKINTIHGSKGMESEVVFIAGLHQGRGGFPCIKEDYDIVKIIKDAKMQDRLEEERRCMYVAITRAKKLLFLITEKDKESVFVKEISRKYCEEVK